MTAPHVATAAAPAAAPAVTSPVAPDWSAALLVSGMRSVQASHELVERCGAADQVRPASRLLCGALGLLAERCFVALGGDEADPRVAAVGNAAALLALLTKLDDQVIDGLPFHGGHAPDRRALRERTQAFLAPTLQSLRTGMPATAEGRCVLAAEAGRAFRKLAIDRARFDDLLDVIAAGWATQVDAVAVLSSHPRDVERGVVVDVTRRISGAWLLMITMVGALPSPRSLTADERAAFFDWGLHIQSADALSDLGKDLREGLICSLPCWEAWTRSGGRVDPAACLEAPGPVYDVVASEAIDALLMPPEPAVEALDRRLRGLVEVSALLRWIHGFLTWRYLVDPMSGRAGDEAAFQPWTTERRSWARWTGAGCEGGPA